MGRPKRSVRSARDRWAKSRRFIPFMERLFGSVRRSMCEQHFDGFQSFRDGLNEVCTLVSGADVKVEEEISAFFPQSPLRMTLDDWRSFKMWLKADMGEPVRHVCMSWYQYWRQCPAPLQHMPWWGNGPC
ncbi:hypothetical protein FRX31_032786 [Thalictrum thalictroides]|uniref:Uncharacterized protein n=1 Tax=Thalictrum thalictroides TaxID=46969 RepID=A0A7J6UYZ1_THATH|nr:hypothetical protein FRX31_032786 [Thalictrum thalictroides]